jgi:lysophospholipase L1-like esterase
VLFLGDSFTYGLGVNDEEALPQQVENLLKTQHYSVEVINAGNPGAGTDYELKFLQTLGPKLKPDLVVVCFFWNDFYDNAEGEHFSLVQGELVPQKPHSLTAKKARVENMPVIGWLLSRSHAANLIKVATVNLLKRPGKPVNRERYSLKDAGYDRALTEKLLGQMVKTAQALGSGIMFFYLPDEGQVKLYKASGEISHYEQDFGAMIRGLHEQPYSLTPALSQVPGDIELPYWGHYRAGTNLAAARYVSGPLEGWLKDRPRP